MKDRREFFKILLGGLGAATFAPSPFRLWPKWGERNVLFSVTETYGLLPRNHNFVIPIIHLRNT